VIDFTRRNDRTANFLKAIYFQYPDWTPCHVEFPPATWMKYRDALEAVVLRHPRLFPHFRKGSRNYDRIKNPLQEIGERTDCWGVMWHNNRRGLDGVPVEHPLDDWSALAEYRRPDPLTDDLFGPRDWQSVERSYMRSRGRGDLAVARELPHGLLFLRLMYLRGVENLMCDFARHDSRLWELIYLVEECSVVVVAECLRRGAECVWIGDDFGMQDRLMVSPETWRTFLLPSYRRILAPCIAAEVPIHFHSDGRILDILPDLVELGIRVIHLQYSANGLEGLQERARGKLALNVDLDRQLFPLVSESVIEDHIREIHEGLWLEKGGLLLHAECGPDVPLTSIEAICSGLETLCGPQ
jgi:uroporphyrinogen decarboxylase